MDELFALEYKKDSTFSVTAVHFSKISWRGITVEDWTIHKYSDIFYLWHRDDLCEFDEHHLNISLFKCFDWNPTQRRYSQKALEEIYEWADIYRCWIYTADFNFNTIKDWTVGR